jgi:hypothetical protein
MQAVSKVGPLTFEDPIDDFIFRRAIVTFGVRQKNRSLVEIKFMTELP